LNTEITENPELLKTELNLEPIRVDGLFLLKTNKKKYYSFRISNSSSIKTTSTITNARLLGEIISPI
jgi:hypothetical protein